MNNNKLIEGILTLALKMQPLGADERALAQQIEALCREAFVGEIEKLIPMIISDLPKVEWLQKKHVIEAIKGMNTGDV